MAPNARTGIILFAHGSRVEEANDGVRALADRVRRSGGFACVAAAFLEMAKPNLATALQEVAQAGVERVIVAPYFLTSGMHLRRDLPALVERERAAHPEIDFAVAEPLEGHSLLVDLLLDRIRTVSDKGGVSA